MYLTLVLAVLALVLGAVRVEAPAHSVTLPFAVLTDILSAV
jgi:hypothetical protein